MVSNNYCKEYISDIELMEYRSNWDQTNENSFDFIVNKPFGKISSNYTTYLLPEAEYPFIYARPFYLYIGECPLEMAGEQTFKINNITYTQTVKMFDDIPYIGNLFLMSPGDYPNTGEDYLIMTYNGGVVIVYFMQEENNEDGNDNIFTLSLQGYFIENKILSEQYLPKILNLSQLNYTHYGTDIPANIITEPQNGQIYCQLIEPETLIIWLYNGEKWFKTN